MQKHYELTGNVTGLIPVDRAFFKKTLTLIQNGAKMYFVNLI